MKTNITTLAFAAFLALSAGKVNAQVPDSVNVNQNSTNTTTTTTQTTTIQSTQPVAPTPTPAPAPEPRPALTVVEADNDNDDRPLRRGEFGIRYMPTFGTLALRTYDNETVAGTLSMSHGWGVMVGFNFSRHVGIVGEVNYNQINQKFKDRNLDRRVSVSYLNIPLMLSLNTNKEAAVNLNFVVGPQFGLNLGASVSGDDGGNADSVRAVVGVKPGDVGAAYGAGLEFALNREHTLRLDLGFRGYYGLVDMRGSQSGSNPDTYNVLLRASRKTYAGYIGLTFLF